MYAGTAGVTHHSAIEEITQVLCAKTQNQDKGFFRPVTAYYLSRMASMMRASVLTQDRGEIPVNAYVIALGTSGYGKGHSVYLTEEHFMKGFNDRFMEDTLPTIAEARLHQLADEKAAKLGSNPDDEFVKLLKEYDRLGEFVSSFDSGTTPAVKQLRQKLLMAGIGSINTAIDEIGLNLVASTEILTLFLELYDQGMVKQKLTKNTAENIRSVERTGKTPTNLLMFGTPATLFDGSTTEDQFYSMLSTGYARRCLWGFGSAEGKIYQSQNPEELFAALIDPSNDLAANKWLEHFRSMADPVYFDYKIIVPTDVGVELLRYKLDCEEQARAYPEHEEIRKAELAHRYFKALKLAGAYAFVDQTPQMTLTQLKQAILLVEESGQSFQHILNREPTYVKLAKFIVSAGVEVTHADLTEKLPYYKTSVSARNEIMSLAMAWGYKRHMIIKKTFVDGIEFFKGESLKETNLEELMLSHGPHYAYHFEPDVATFSELPTLMTQDNYNWCSHRFVNKHRTIDNTIAGFNMIVVDIDGTVPLSTVHQLLHDYTFMTHTTKSHTPTDNCFRLIIPMNYVLHLDANEYKEFMTSFLSWLPFKVDESAIQRERKWSTNAKAICHINEGELIDVMRFIPKTSKNMDYLNQQKSVESMENLERWFAGQMQPGNRNNMMIRYALTLVDGGSPIHDVMEAVKSFNAKLNQPLTDDELSKTIFTTVAKRYTA